MTITTFFSYISAPEQARTVLIGFWPSWHPMLGLNLFGCFELSLLKQFQNLLWIQKCMVYLVRNAGKN